MRPSSAFSHRINSALNHHHGTNNATTGAQPSNGGAAPRRPLLRKQNSCADVVGTVPFKGGGQSQRFLTTGGTSSGIGGGGSGSTARRPMLRKQLSMDHAALTTSPFAAANNRAQHQQQATSYYRVATPESGNGRSSQNNNNVMTMVPTTTTTTSTTTSNKVVAVNRRHTAAGDGFVTIDHHTPTTTTITQRDDKSGNSTPERRRGGDDRININIFLSPTSQHSHAHDVGEPSDSERDSSSSCLSSDAQQNSAASAPKTLATPMLATAAVSTPSTAADRRATFLANRSFSASAGSAATEMVVGRKIIPTTNTTSTNANAVTQPALPSPSSSSSQPTSAGQRRPPLLRAMSAPIRPHQDDTKQMLAKRRLSRRRRAAPQRDRSADNAAGSPFYMDRLDEVAAGDVDKRDTDTETMMTTTLAAGIRTTNGRSRSAMSGRNDVVTLVSLLSSSGGSDSEHEDGADEKAEEPVALRAPSLKRTGKSVSFQETEPVNANAAANQVRDEFPLVLRRGSIAPLAARIRANRPPTAPAGSIYMRQEFQRSSALQIANATSTSTIGMLDADNVVVVDDSATTASNNCNNGGPEATTSSTTTAPTPDDRPNNKAASAAPDPIAYPAFCRSAKERECWVLFQKMLKKGVNVSYETLLRGLLTPTEMRTVLKQREADEEKQRQLDEEQKLHDEEGTAIAVAAGNVAQTVRCS